MVQIFKRQPILAALLSAPLLCLASPGGGGLWPLLFVGLVPLLLAVREMNGRQVLFAGMLTGTFCFILLLYWIVIVLGRYGNLPLFVTVPALLLLAAYMGVYLCIFMVVARHVIHQLRPVLVLFCLPALWVGLDWLRGVAFTGFPWMDLGYGLWEVPQLIQISDLFGHYGITYLVVFVNTLLALLFIRKLTGTDRFQLAVPVLLLLLAVSFYSYSSWQRVGAGLAEPAATIRMGIVQGNIDQGVKWSPEHQQKTLDIYLQETRSLFTGKRPSLVVWPETALPFYPPSSKNLGGLRNLTAQYDVALLTGAPWYEIIDRKARKVRFFNSALLLEPDGEFSGKYYKTHLVPFGEYVPLKKYLPFLAPLVESVGDFSSGTIARPLAREESRAGILICFESIFSDIARKWVNSGANVLVNLTNDAWYGKSSAPYQSMAMSVFRAVETRRSLVRSANTGISGFVDPLGRVQQSSPIFEVWAGVEDVVLRDDITFFVRFGYLFAPCCLLLGLISGAIVFFRGRVRPISD